MTEQKAGEFLKHIKTELLLACLKKHGESTDLKRNEALEKLQKLLGKSDVFLDYIDFYERMGKKQTNKGKFLTLISKSSSAPAKNGIEKVKNWRSRLMICYLSDLSVKNVEAIFWQCRIADKRKKIVYLLEPQELELKTVPSVDSYIKKYNEQAPLKMLVKITPSETSGSLDSTIRVQKELTQKTIRSFKDRNNVMGDIDSASVFPLVSKVFHLRKYDNLWHIQTSYDLEVSSRNENEYRAIVLETLKLMFARDVSLREETSSKINGFEKDMRNKKTIGKLGKHISKLKANAKKLVDKDDSLDAPTKEKYKQIIDTFGIRAFRCKDDSITLREMIVDGNIALLESRKDSSLGKTRELLRKGGKVDKTYEIDDKKVEFFGGKKRANLSKEEEHVLELLMEGA